jgi:hypothetical protein
LEAEEPPIDYVRFAPWGKPERPYFFEKQTVVTLTAPWLEGTEIYYTTDGNEPTAKWELYTKPLTITQTQTLRAAAVRNDGGGMKRRASLFSHAQYVLLPDKPVEPNVYLEDLNFIPNAYAVRLPMWIWTPQKGKSFEGKTLRIRGKTYAHGMGFRAPSSVQYEIKPEYKRFVALAGVDDNLLSQNNGRFLAMHSSVQFKVSIDGKIVAESPVMRISQEAWRFDVPIPPNSRRINLSCTDAGSRHLLDFGNWADAGFVTESDKKEP